MKKVKITILKTTLNEELAREYGAIGSMTGHAEGSKAFARYRKVELELKKSLTDMLD